MSVYIWGCETTLIKSESVTGTLGAAWQFFSMACAASYLFCLFLIPHAIRDSASHCTGVLSGWEGSGPERTRLCNPPPHLLVAHLQVGNTWFLWRASKERGARGPKEGQYSGFRAGMPEACCVYLQCIDLIGMPELQNIQMLAFCMGQRLGWHF